MMSATLGLFAMVSKVLKAGELLLFGTLITGITHVLLRPICVYFGALCSSPGCGTLLGIHLLLHWCPLC